jgi:hypothetical protein
MKRSLVTLMAIASLTIADTAQAALGWTLDECQQHYGKPISSMEMAGFPVTTFVYQSYRISVLVSDGKVVLSLYIKPSITDADLMRLLFANGTGWAPGLADSNGKSWQDAKKDIAAFVPNAVGNVDMFLVGTPEAVHAFSAAIQITPRAKTTGNDL